VLTPESQSFYARDLDGDGLVDLMAARVRSGIGAAGGTEPANSSSQSPRSSACTSRSSAWC